MKHTKISLSYALILAVSCTAVTPVIAMEKLLIKQTKLMKYIQEYPDFNWNLFDFNGKNYSNRLANALNKQTKYLPKIVKQEQIMRDFQQDTPFSAQQIATIFTVKNFPLCTNETTTHHREHLKEALLIKAANDIARLSDQFKKDLLTIVVVDSHEYQELVRWGKLARLAPPKIPFFESYFMSYMLEAEKHTLKWDISNYF